MGTRSDHIHNSSEQGLERSGDINGLQWKRWDAWREKLPVIAKTEDTIGLIMTEVKLRRTTQHEIALKIQLQEAHDRLRQIHAESAVTKHIISAKIKTLEQELEAVSREYWFLERKWWSIRAAFDETCLTRGISLWRSNPNWYMHRILNEDCAERGGCCGRDCNCCSARQNIPGRRFVAGHCTTRCHCCEKARGFVLSVEETKMLDEQFNVSRPGYCRRIRNASLLGLVAGNYKDNPFDMIEGVPPAYSAS